MNPQADCRIHNSQSCNNSFGWKKLLLNRRLNQDFRKKILSIVERWIYNLMACVWRILFSNCNCWFRFLSKIFTHWTTLTYFHFVCVNFYSSVYSSPRFPTASTQYFTFKPLETYVSHPDRGTCSTNWVHKIWRNPSESVRGSPTNTLTTTANWARLQRFKRD
jgi:hypothetical protein